LSFGHSGTGVGAYAPEGESRKIQWINDGQTEIGAWRGHPARANLQVNSD